MSEYFITMEKTWDACISEGYLLLILKHVVGGSEWNNTFKEDMKQKNYHYENPQKIKS